MNDVYYYVVWYTHGALYYLYDSTHDYQQVTWTTSANLATPFVRLTDAKQKADRLTEMGRKGIAVITI